MKRSAIQPLIPMMLLLLVFVNGCKQEPPINSSERFVYFATQLGKLQRVTPKRVAMDRPASQLCASIAPLKNFDELKTNDTKKPPRNHDHLVKYGQAELQVYVTSPGRRAIKDGSVGFPLGTMILKQKFPGPYATSAELFTGMLKREKGFNPDCGDWEFFTLTGDGKTVTSRGRIESCMDCHKDFLKTDFVSRKYP